MSVPGLVVGAFTMGSLFLGGGRSSVSQLQHIIIIVQENRSFDSYFGTYPGADGIPKKNGKFTICDPDPKTHTCVYSYHDTADVNYGGPHDTPNEIADIDGGKMDGFIKQSYLFSPKWQDVMGFHDDREIPNYWSYARSYVLQDEMYAPSTSYSGPQHLFLVSGWSASCTIPNDPRSCSNGYNLFDNQTGSFAWTDITYLLHKAHVSWKYYVFTGSSPDVVNPGEDGGMTGRRVRQNYVTAGDWNPLPDFSTVVQDNQLSNVTNGDNYYTDAAQGTLPAVSWIVPTDLYSEHPPQSVRKGMQYVTGLIDAAMQSPDWNTTAILLVWDDWGGFFEHEVPTTIDWAGYGIRVPSLVISPWARHGYIDHQLLSFDAYNKLIEDLFLGGQRLDPNTDGRWDPRPDVRESYPGLGDLLNDFDFTQTPTRPIVLPDAIIVH